MSAERLTIGDVASRAGVNIQTLRYYERRRLLPEPPRLPSGYRQYPADTVRLVRFMKRAQALGFTLREVQELLRLREARARSRPAVRAVAEAKLKTIDEKIRRLRAMRKALDGLLTACAGDGARSECPILEALDDEVTE